MPTPDSPPDRRAFLARSSAAAGGAWLARFGPLIAAAQACAAADRREALPFTTFTPREGADFDALADRILPADDTPGAREAGAVYFADRALGSFLAELLPEVRAGLARLHERSSAADGSPFAELRQARQDELLGEVEREDPGFFYFARALVVLGVVSDPSHGGNRDGVGWAMIGFDDDFAYQPPFGFYDREEHGSGA